MKASSSLGLQSTGSLVGRVKGGPEVSEVSCVLGHQRADPKCKSEGVRDLKSETKSQAQGLTRIRIQLYLLCCLMGG